MDVRRGRRRAGHLRPTGAATLHEHGIPVRRGGAPYKRDNDRALQRAGTITERFPTPAEVTNSFLAEAYTEIGLAAGHIEQLTGQPAERVLQMLHEQGVPIRQSGSQSPWLQRQRER